MKIKAKALARLVAEELAKYDEDEGRIYTNSLIVAERFGRQHSKILRSIDRRFNSKSEKVRAHAAANFGFSEYLDLSGKSNRMALMTKDGFLELTMSFTGDEAAEIRIAFIEAFNRISKTLKRIESQPLEPGWQRARLEGKERRAKFTEAIAEFKAFCIENGSEGMASHCFETITSMICRALFSLSAREVDNVRAILEDEHLQRLGDVENYAAVQLKKLLKAANASGDGNYKAMYQALEARFSAMSTIWNGHSRSHRRNGIIKWHRRPRITTITLRLPAILPTEERPMSIER